MFIRRLATFIEEAFTVTKNTGYLEKISITGVVQGTIHDSYNFSLGG
jgi:hypothetical protein